VRAEPRTLNKENVAQFYNRNCPADQILRHGWQIGDCAYGNPRIWQWGIRDGTLKIGRYGSISSGVDILLGGNHQIDCIANYPFSFFLREKIGHIQGQPAMKGDVVIGNDVWIGMKCVVLFGVTIGGGAVVATKSGSQKCPSMRSGCRQSCKHIKV
jgi:acetyltransferase-like isoleucine patch superfamily enzyme